MAELLAMSLPFGFINRLISGHTRTGGWIVFCVS